MDAKTKHHQVADQLFAELGTSFLRPAIKDILDDPDCRIFVACSGGADSVFILYWIFEYLKKQSSLDRLQVLHFNHCLRGEASDGDEQFVRDICAGLDIPIHISRWERLDFVEAVSEAEARTARFRFFQSICKSVDNSFVFTGHHGGDVVETMLMRLSRGSGSVGLSAPRPISDPGLGFWVCRPLLGLTSEKVRTLLNRQGGFWREDASNQSNDFYRNRIRNSVIPAWQRASDRDILPGVLMARERLEEDSKALEVWLDSLWDDLTGSQNTLDLERFTQIEPALQRRAIDRFLVQTGCNVAFEVAHWSILQQSLKNGEISVISLSDSVRFVVDPAKGKIELKIVRESASWHPFHLPIQGLAFLPDGSSIQAEIVEINDELLNSVRSGAFSHSDTVYLKVKHPQSVAVRVWRHGDRYWPHGLGKSKKVSKLFIDRKVPLDLRSRLPFFVSNRDEILWVPHLPPNQSYLVDHNDTHALQLIYKACDVVS